MVGSVEQDWHAEVAASGPQLTGAVSTVPHLPYLEREIVLRSSVYGVVRNNEHKSST
jgi:hypothetical protein